MSEEPPAQGDSPAAAAEDSAPHQDSPQERALQEQLGKEERLVRLGVLAFAGCLLLAIILSVQLSTVGVNFGTLVYGSPALWPGHIATYRVGALDPVTSRLVPNVRAVVSLEDDTGSRLQVGASGPEFAEASLKVPVDYGGQGPAQVRVTLENELGRDEVLVPLETRSPGPPPLRLTPHWSAWTQEAGEPEKYLGGDLQVAIYPDAGEAVRGLDNPCTARVTEKGEPLANVKITSELLGLQTRTDAHGLFRFTFQTPLKPEAVPFVVGEAPGRTVKVPLDFRPVQMWMEVSPGPWVKPGDILTVRLDTLPFRRPIHVDVWIGDLLLLGTSEAPQRGRRELEVVLPPDARGWLRISAYRLLGAPEGNLSTRWGWISPLPPPEAAAEALAALAELPGQDPILQAAQSAQEPALRQRLTELAITRLQAREPGMPLLRNNLAERQARVESRVGEMRAALNVFFAALVALGLLTAGALVLHHQVRVRAGVRGVMEDGIAAGEEAIDAASIAKLTRFGHTYDLLLVLGALGLAGYGIWMLLQHITWQ